MGLARALPEEPPGSVREAVLHRGGTYPWGDFFPVGLRTRGTQGQHQPGVSTQGAWCCQVLMRPLT